MSAVEKWRSTKSVVSTKVIRTGPASLESLQTSLSSPAKQQPLRRLSSPGQVNSHEATKKIEEGRQGRLIFAHEDDDRCNGGEKCANMGPVLALSLLWLAHVAIEITGDAGCPEPAAVSRNLTSLLPAVWTAATSAAPGEPGAASPLPPSVRLSRTATGELEILLVGPDGRRRDEKRFEAAAGCDDLAAAVAVVIASWASEPALSLPQRVDLPRPAAPLSTHEEPASVAGASAAVGSSIAVVVAPWRPSSTAIFRLGAVASSTAGQWAAGLRAGSGVILWGDRWGLGAVAAATMPRSEAVGSVPGAGRWARGYLGIGPEVSLLRSGAVTLTAHLQGLLALLHVTGNGLENATSDTSLRFGTTGGIWSAWQGWSSVWPWIGADLLFWPGRERLRVEGLAMEGAVPGLEAQIAAGLGIGLFP